MRKLYFTKMIYRVVLLAIAAVAYFIDGERLNPLGEKPLWTVLGLIWASVIVDFVGRLIPNKKLSSGCQKEFAYAYVPREYDNEILKRHKKEQDRRALILFIVWIAAHIGIWSLYILKVLHEKELIMLSLLYNVGDMICILYWCPFKSLFLKNKCCATCRIFTWDAFMMVSPIAIIPSILTLSIVLFGIFLSVRWEINYYRHPERFYEVTNKRIACAGCNEHLCRGRNELERKFKKVIGIKQAK